jgi:hypothetical protein
MAVLTIKGKTTNDSVAIKNPTGDKTYFTAGETSATLGTGVTIGSGVTGTLGSGVTIGSGVTFPAGHIIKTQIHENGTRTVLSNSAAAATRNDLWTFTVNKSLSSTDLLFTIALDGGLPGNGWSNWFIRKSGGTQRPLGGANHYPQYNAGVPLIGSIPAADTDAGDNIIIISWSSLTGKAFSIWNPNSADTSEKHYQGYSKAISHEIVP